MLCFIYSKLCFRSINFNCISSFCRLHTPVMANEVLRFLSPTKNNLFLDMTFGCGGHSKVLLQEEPSLKLICLDRDPDAYSKAVEMSKEFPNRVIPSLGRFSELPEVMKNLGLKYHSLDGILFDLGCSSAQLEAADRGFSINEKGFLDMRMDGKRFPDSPTALDVLRKADEVDLAKIFKIYGEEKQAKKIARAIVEARYTFRELKTTEDLSLLIYDALNSPGGMDKQQRPSQVIARVTLALRIFVNNELNELSYGMTLADWFLKVGGRLVTVCSNSLEDRIVKRHLTGMIESTGKGNIPLMYASHSLSHDQQAVENAVDTNWMTLTKHVITPSSHEMENNSTIRTAKLRAALKIK